MESIADNLNDIVNDFYEKYLNLDDDKASINLADDKWSLKEIIGHLIDSASNNHQRFVRLQTEKTMNFPDYHYNWIKVEKYNLIKFKDLISLWKYYNILLSHIIKNTEDDKLSNIWKTEDKDITLKELITHYFAHLKEHLKHFEERLNELK